MAYHSLYSKTPSLFVDQYAMTMAQADASADELKRITTSQVFFRQLINNGFKNSEGKDLKIPYLVVAGLGPFIEWLDHWQCTAEDAAFLATVTGPSGERLFSDELLAHLKGLKKLTVQIDAMLEGELAFPDEPIVRITGPHYQVQMVEAALLCAMTEQVGLATIASQFWLAAQRFDKQAKLFEFGARRGPWGGLATGRSACLAGWDGTSNFYAAQVYGLPSVGTMAHSFIMVRSSELEAFTTWAKHMPHLGVFLVDTYDSLEGVRTAIKVCKEHGVKLRGIRLDSGDIDYLSRQASAALKAAGMDDVAIMASDSLSVGAIHQVFQVQRAPIDSFGVGGNYVGRRQDTVGVSAVMKVARDHATGRDLMKYSEAADKATFPGVQDVIRYLEPASNEDGFQFAGDTIVPHALAVGGDALTRELVSIPRHAPNKLKPFPAGTKFYRPLVRITDEQGKHVRPEFQAQDAPRILREARARFIRSMRMLAPEHKQIISPRLYIAGVEESLHSDQAGRVRRNFLNAERQRQAARFTTQAS